MALHPEDPISRRQVEDAVVRLFVATDERDRTAVESCFTDPFVLDMTSMTGGSPATMTPRQVATAWAEGFRSLAYVHHQVGNVQASVEGQQAEVRCHGIAYHHRAAIRSPVK